MKPTDFSLDVIDVASPCDASWDAMRGDARVKFCADCKLNVYNLSEMSQDDATELVRQSEGRLCVRFYRRTDGTILTRDCPVGLRAIRRRIARSIAAIAALVVFLLSGCVTARSKSSNPRSAANGALSKLAEWVDPWQGEVEMGDVMVMGAMEAFPIEDGPECDDPPQQ